MESPKNKALVTVIIATYNRPDVLSTAIRSVQSQTIKDWVCYVIGDGCSQSTQDLMDRIDDDRVFYYNNPFRYGEQAGGNSIGMALAETEYIAFLNHDDLWTPNHLEVAISSLKNNNTDFYIGRAAMSRLVENGVPKFKMVNPVNRKPYYGFLAHYMLSEPVSSWVLKTDKAMEIGYWKRKIELYRSSAQEYIMRAWRKRIKFDYGKKITSAYLSYHNNRELRKGSQKTSYEYKGKENEYILKLFQKKYDDFEELIKPDKLTEHKFKKINPIPPKSMKLLHIILRTIYNVVFNKVTAYLYYFTGIDIYTIAGKIFLSKDWRVRVRERALRNKTGDTKIKMHNMEEVIEYAKKHFPKTT
ncbi:glycosyltransferase family 2 protein [Patescibacteria group bacterium]|nr:glycosyltransferase family 2 protein [Patescibacteria group bacterium]MBU1682483.1 glycosyltransferase family 2 protein [Patescibacteria group bacterium]MBU1934701.1 glycosyltransferase family 2 protein [Patescibacteria group bacterium]